ncbi:MAG: radical SAM protein [Clostridia bacterium]|nr:radical SAM protein [Clostridia bacterium]
METEKTGSYPLYTLLIEVTQKCNAACDQCGSRCDIRSEELLSKEQILAALRDIKENIGTYTMLNITGGEPLLRRDLFEMMREASDMGFEWGMVTNGSLITDDVIESMRSAGMKTATVSLDGLQETHDSLRHLPGSWKHILEALKKLKKAAFLDHLQVTFTANRRNVYEFEALYRILGPIGLDSIRVSFMDPIGRALDNADLLLTREEILYFTGVVNACNRREHGTKVIWGCPHYLGTLLENRRFSCFAGKYTASILVNGDIFVCPNVERRPEFVQGNILNDSFSEVWKNGFGVFRQRKLPEKCAGCKYEKQCAGDSVHTMDFEKNEPKFCFLDHMEAPSPAAYKENLFRQYPGLSFYEISAEENDAVEVLIEPEAWQDIARYFHIGKKHPQSMYEQQMALIGFYIGNTAAIRYVVPCDGALRAEDNAVFTGRITKKAEKELQIINANYYKSDDRSLCGSELSASEPMRFLGFIHSHPTQSELQYSTGDEAIHERMLKKYGAYIGILVNPAEGAVGAYSGKDLRQAKLIVPDM